MKTWFSYVLVLLYALSNVIIGLHIFMRDPFGFYRDNYGMIVTIDGHDPLAILNTFSLCCLAILIMAGWYTKKPWPAFVIAVLIMTSFPLIVNLFAQFIGQGFNLHF